MKLEDLIALTKAGFTAQEIRAMASAEKPETPAQEPAQAPQPEAPKQEPQKPEPEKAPDGTAAILEAITGLTKAIQTNGIKTSDMPPSESVHDILAAIINPPEK